MITALNNRLKEAIRNWLGIYNLAERVMNLEDTNDSHRDLACLMLENRGK